MERKKGFGRYGAVLSSAVMLKAVFCSVVKLDVKKKGAT